jgi:glycopeptide antibiotics resistance protein
LPSRREVNAVAWFVPGVACSIVVSLIVAPLAARTLRTSRLVAWLLVFSFGVILSATATPIQAALDGGGSGRACDLSRIGFASLADLFAINDTSLNVLLFVPLGWTLGLIPNTPRQLILALLVLALPFGIEALQLWAPILGRGCESADVVDNLTGLGLGFAGATAFHWVRPVPRSPGDPASRA